MTTARYTAKVVHKQKTLFEKSHSNFDEIQAALLASLHYKYINASGIIIDNKSGRTVNSYRKISCYD